MAQSSTVKNRASYDDVLASPPEVVAELLNGVLHTSPRPSPRHALALSHLTIEVGGPFGLGRGGPGGWWILDEPELHLRQDVVVPDIAGWRRERMADLPETSYIDLAPDWICEVHSPSTRRIDRFEKWEIYRVAGVPYLWFVDPDVRGLEAFELRDGQWVLTASLKDEEEVRVPPFQAISFSLAGLWP